MFRSIYFVAAAIALSAGAASALSVSPVSYDMPNGSSGSYNYWDDAYNGSGNNQSNLAPLSGGVGDLTDGIIATDNWFNVESPLGPNGPYVGWTINPRITFNFGSVFDFLSVTFHFDDSNGSGGVSAPASVAVNGVSTAIPEPSGSAPFAFTVDLTGTSTDTLVVDVTRKNGWVFLSEVEFDVAGAPPVPVPASVLLLGSAIAGFGLRRRKRPAG